MATLYYFVNGQLEHRQASQWVPSGPDHFPTLCTAPSPLATEGVPEIFAIAVCQDLPVPAPNPAVELTIRGVSPQKLKFFVSPLWTRTVLPGRHLFSETWVVYSDEHGTEVLRVNQRLVS